MIRHVVMWTLKETAEGATRAENACRLQAELEGLRAHIPVIRALEVGLAAPGVPGGWDAVLVTTFDSQADLARYLEHPEHRRVADWIGRVRAERAVVDYAVASA